MRYKSTILTYLLT